MPKEYLGYDLKGNRLPYSDEEAGKQANKIFDKGNLILVVSELDGSLSIQIMGKPSLRVLHILVEAADSYRNVLKDKGLI